MPTEHGPWIQDPDFDVAGAMGHMFSLPDPDFNLFVNGIKHYLFSDPPPPNVVDPTDAHFQTAWQSAEASTDFETGGGNAGTTVRINVEGSFPFPGPTTYHGDNFLNVIFTKTNDVIYDDPQTPAPPGWGSREWEDPDQIGDITEAVLEQLLINDDQTPPVDTSSWTQYLSATTDYTPVTYYEQLPFVDPSVMAWSNFLSRGTSGGDLGFQLLSIGEDLTDFITNRFGLILMLNSIETSSASMVSESEGDYGWGSFISTGADPGASYMRYRIRPPRYRYSREFKLTATPARQLWPRDDSGGISIGNFWPPPNNPQAGGRLGSSAPY